jgi:hypothetical protein
MKKIVVILLILVPHLLFGVNYYVAPASPPTGWSAGNNSNNGTSKSTPKLTLAGAFAVMSGGDTLIIADGTYTGTANQIRYNQKPPNGSAGAYTTLQAENVGSVYFDGAGSVSMMDSVNSLSGASYWKFYGLRYIRDGSIFGATGTSSANRNTSYIQFIKCGIQDMIDISYASYVLLEDCYVTGQGRYNFEIFCSDHVVLRRCVARLDNGNGAAEPISNFVNYNAQYVEFQNCIAIDSDDAYYSNFEGTKGGFYNRMNAYGYGDNNIQRGCIVLNVKHSEGGSGSAAFANLIAGDASNYQVQDGIYWDMHNVSWAQPSWSHSYIENHCTWGVSASGDSNYMSFVVGSSSYGDITNSIFYSCGGTAIAGAHTSNYNSFYGNAGTKSSVGSSTGDVTNINPLTNHLKYLPRIESATGLDGNDGRKMGATILYKMGTDGTMWGETGYATLSANALWPYPQEDLIKSFFVTYGTGSGSPANARGFCTGNSIDGSAQTLTKYIWEYIGNQIPSDIYGGSSPTKYVVVTK